MKKSIFAKGYRDEGFIFGNFDIDQDLTNSLLENWRDFNREFIPIYLQQNPEKSKDLVGFIKLTTPLTVLRNTTSDR